MEETHNLIESLGVSYKPKSIRAVGWKQLGIITVSRYNTLKTKNLGKGFSR